MEAFLDALSPELRAVVEASLAHPDGREMLRQSAQPYFVDGQWPSSHLTAEMVALEHVKRAKTVVDADLAARIQKLLNKQVSYASGTGAIAPVLAGAATATATGAGAAGLKVFTDKQLGKLWQSHIDLADVFRGDIRSVVSDVIQGVTSEANWELIGKLATRAGFDPETWEAEVGQRLGDGLMSNLAGILGKAAWSGQREALDSMPQGTRLTDFQEATQDWVQSYVARLAQGQRALSSRTARESIHRWLEQGASEKTITERIRQVFALSPRQAMAVDNRRRGLIDSERSSGAVSRDTRRYAEKLLGQKTQLIARTESVASLNFGRQIMYEKAVGDGTLPTDTHKQWITAGDEWVCFPPWTGVATPQGERRIENVGVGDEVATPRGKRVVTDTSARSYDGVMTLVAADGHRSITTVDHPYWSPDRRWVEAGDLRPGDTLQNVGDEMISVRAVVNLIRVESDDGPALIAKSFVAPGVLGVVVPERTVDFEGDLVDGEVDTQASYRVFLDVVDAEAVQRLSDEGLGSCLAHVGAVAAERTETSIRGRDGAELDAAGVTVHDDRRASTFLRAVPVGTLSPDSERQPASTTIATCDCAVSAVQRADGVTIGVHDRDSELLLASRAGLGDTLSSVGFVARTGAMGSVETPAFSGIEEHPASITDAGLMSSLSQPLAGLRAEHALELGSLGSGHVATALMALVGERHPESFSTLVSYLWSSVTVYDLTVEVDECFYADGVLVHNCPHCRPMDGVSVPLNQGFDTTLGTVFVPPNHPMCRCLVVPVARSLVTPVAKHLGGSSGVKDHPSGTPQTVHAGGEKGKAARLAALMNKTEGSGTLSIEELEDQFGAEYLNRVQQGVTEWQGSFKAIKRLRGLLDGSIQPNDAKNPKFSDESLLTLQRLVEQAPANSPTLYRGIRIKAEPKQVEKMIREGDTLDPTIASFSSNREIADNYGIRNVWKPFRRGKTGVTFVLDEGSRGVHVEPLGLSIEESLVGSLDEWVVQGSFEVTKVEKTNEHHYDVHVRQKSSSLSKAAALEVLSRFLEYSIRISERGAS